MALIKIKYLGQTSTGKFSKYEIIPIITPASGKNPEIIDFSIEKLKHDEVLLNKNFCTCGFLSQTHLYLTPQIGDEVEVDVKGFVKNITTTINYFSGIDKDKQEQFSKMKKIEKEFVENSLFIKKMEEYDLKGSDLKLLEEIKLIKDKRRLVNLQIKGLGVED